ncbi:MAG: HNH endonuclease family protein [Actinomycetota bacterium]|nr:HNH endonuclease family protein [Actinomycetota bacterium]
MRKLPGIVVIAVLVVMAVAGINSWSGSSPGLGGSRTPRAPVIAPLSPPDAGARGARRPGVARGRAAPAHDRDAFGEAWADVDGNGCNQRDDVLLRDAEPGTAETARQGACDHDVLAGSWVDPYTGARLVMTDMKDPAQAQAVQIDHVVPLAEAWRSGASAWSDARRERYANDLGVLVASDGATTQSKGVDDPAAWLPTQEFQCDYALTWVAVKDAWSLAVDDSEAAALTGMLERCPARRNDPVR